MNSPHNELDAQLDAKAEVREAEATKIYDEIMTQLASGNIETRTALKIADLVRKYADAKVSAAVGPIIGAIIGNMSKATKSPTVGDDPFGPSGPRF